MHARALLGPGNNGLVGQGKQAYHTCLENFVAHSKGVLLLIFGVQVFQTGKLIVFNKNCLEIATKTTLFKSYQAGLDGENQVAMLSNLVAFFDA